MEKILEQLLDIKTLAIILGGGFALYQYNKQLKFRRLQNLTMLFNRFISNDILLDLFNEMDKDNSDIKKIEAVSPKIKLEYLALLEEVALHFDYFEVDKKHTKYLFQWLFYYVYICPVVSEAFWHNIGGISEIKKEYWQKSRILAIKINPL